MGSALQKLEDDVMPVVRKSCGKVRLIGVPAALHSKDVRRWCRLFYEMLCRGGKVHGDEEYLLAYLARAKTFRLYRLEPSQTMTWALVRTPFSSSACWSRAAAAARAGVRLVLDGRRRRSSGVSPRRRGSDGVRP